LILLDLNLPDRDGFGMLSELRKTHPSVTIVVMSGQQDHDSVLKALNLGALGFIPKSASRKVILGALQLVMSGGIYIPPQALPQPTTMQSTPETSPSPPTVIPLPMRAPDKPTVPPAKLGLTERQADVLSLIMQGKSNKA